MESTVTEAPRPAMMTLAEMGNQIRWIVTGELLKLIAQLRMCLVTRGLLGAGQTAGVLMIIWAKHAGSRGCFQSSKCFILNSPLSPLTRLTRVVLCVGSVSLESCWGRPGKFPESSVCTICDKTAFSFTFYKCWSHFNICRKPYISDIVSCLIFWFMRLY